MSLRDDLIALGLRLPDGGSLDEWAAKLTDSPARNTAATVAVSSLLFYAAEKERNPKVNDLWDAMVYCSTCLSVGYGDIFAKTPLGKILGSTLMTVGPALSGAALDGRVRERDEAQHRTQEQILATLQQILRKLEVPASESMEQADRQNHREDGSI